jgi:DNA-binding NarL/FixJ family response regulator
VRATARGEAVFTPGLAGLVLGEFRRMASEPEPEPVAAPAGASRPIPELTARETEVLRLVATGMSYKEIAAELFLSHRTVQNHVQNTLGKLHLHNRVELVRFALAHGLEDDDPQA